MKIVSYILDAIGVILTIYGIQLNSSPASQIQSLFENGEANPGNTYVILGIIFIIVGVVLFFISKNQENSKKN